MAGSGIIFLLACGAFLSAAALRVCDALLPRVADEFARSHGEAGYVVTYFALAYGVMQLLFGPLGDRYGKQRLVCLALFGCAVGAIMSLLSGSFTTLVAGRLVWGMAAAGIVPLAMAWIGDAVPYERRQATLARFLTGTLTGMIAGQLLGGIFAERAAGWRGAFVLLTLGYLVVGTLLTLHVRRTPAPPRAAAAGKLRLGGNFGNVIKSRWSRIVLLAVLAEGVFLLGPMAYIPSYLHERFGLSLTVAAGITALYAVGGLAYAMFARRILARIGEHRMLAYGGVLVGAGFLAWWVVPYWGAAGLTAFAVGFGTYLFHNTLQTHATQMAPQFRGTAVSLFAFCLFTGQALGVLLAGLLVDRASYVPMLAAAALAMPLAGCAAGAGLARIHGGAGGASRQPR